EESTLEEVVTLFVRDSFVARMATIRDTTIVSRRKREETSEEKKRTYQFDVLRRLTPCDLLNMANYSNMGPVTLHQILCALVSHEAVTEHKRKKSTRDFLDAIPSYRYLRCCYLGHWFMQVFGN